MHGIIRKLYYTKMQMKVVCEFGKLLRTAVTVVIKTLIKKSRAVFLDYSHLQKSHSNGSNKSRGQF